MVADIASGLINSTFLSANQALAQVQTGTIRIIAAISDGRSKYFPDVPTMAEQGFAEAQVTPWFGIVVPAGTPAADRRAHQQGAGSGAGHAGGAREARPCRMCGEKRAARRSSPTSSSPTSRSGRRSSRTPVSRRIELTVGRQPAQRSGRHVPLGGRIPSYKSGTARSRSRCPWPFAAIVQTDTVVLAFDRSADLWQLPAAAGDDRDDEHRQRRLDPPHRCDLCRTAAPAKSRRRRRGDRPPHQRTAAGGARFRHRSGGAVRSGLGGGLLAERAAEEDAAAARARAAGDDRRRHAAARQLPRRNRARHRPDRAPRRTGRGPAADPRAVRTGDRRRAGPGHRAKPVPGAEPDCRRRCWRTIRRPPSSRRSACGR